MPFTPEELAAMAAADAEIEAEFFLTNEEAAASSARDREARYLAMDKRGQAVAERQRRYREANKEAVAEYHRRYYEANKAKWRDYNAKQKAKKAAALMQRDSGQPEDPATNTSQV